MFVISRKKARTLGKKPHPWIFIVCEFHLRKPGAVGPARSAHMGEEQHRTVWRGLRQCHHLRGECRSERSKAWTFKV
jgi:hypothetical protein